MKPRISIFYHCLFFIGDPPQFLPNAFMVVNEQMDALSRSGLEAAADEIHIGINGGQESEDFAKLLFPKKSQLTFHGLGSRSENLTLVGMQDWVRSHPDWLVLYHHAKGATRSPDNDYGQREARWRRCMQLQVVYNWRRCVADLARAEAVGCHWRSLPLSGKGQSQNYFAGTFFWVRSNFMATIPSMLTRERIKLSGIGSLESRYEAEVLIGTGPRLPRVIDYAHHELWNCP